jgi:hypothetical protein
VNHSTKFFSYKVFDFGDLNAGGSYSVIVTLLCVLCTNLKGIQSENKRDLEAVSG